MRPFRPSSASLVLADVRHEPGAGERGRRGRWRRSQIPDTYRSAATLDELDQAIAATADIVLLDNFSLADLREAVALQDRS